MAISDKVSKKKSAAYICGNIFSRIYTVFTTTVIIIAAIVVILYMFHIRPYIVTSGSMEPAIHIHSVCFVNERFPLADINTGDIISFRLGEDLLVTHRVTAIENGNYYTRGDANNTDDPTPVTEQNYIGKTILSIPGIGTLLTFLHTRTGISVAAVIVILLLVISFIPTKKTRKGIPDEQEET